MPLNYNYGFWRMTQLFGRSLFIRYYKQGKQPSEKGEIIGLDGEVQGAADQEMQSLGGGMEDDGMEQIGFENEDLPDQF